MSARHRDPAHEDDPARARADNGGDDAARTGEEAAAGPMRERRRRSNRPRVLLIAAIAFLLIVGAVVAYLLLSDREGEAAEPVTPDPITTTLPAPTPDGEPMKPTGGTPLAEALPGVVLDHVLTAQEADADAFADHQALEGWFLTYSAPGSDIGLHVLQWEEAADAVAFAEDVVERENLADGEGRRSGDVAVEGESVGRYEIGVLSGAEEPGPVSTPVADDAEPVAVPEPLGPGMAVWTNGTVAFVATGDAARLAQFYDNFPF